MTNRTFVDTSGLFALLDEADQNHEAASRWFGDLEADPSHNLFTHNYVLVETCALVASRLGHEAAKRIFEVLFPEISCIFVDETTHALALSAFLAGGKQASLVDRTSFEVMRQMGIQQAFAFDEDFTKQGFATVP